ncbi:hypothetical protein BDZ94DRAFT_1305280 [Collybia nuda]|uniref:SMODS and SLOG-associating 2TM effector domain-containing protein n=1 Tax=Collybia nuda TaxID=64659 RepID=A0A9P5YCQ7_9AGAR|nr:hypothetical protein BDZ94DRAFT_1305280 [Collybia nuda]
MDRNQEPDYPIDPHQFPVAHLPTQSPPVTQTPSTQTSPSNIGSVPNPAPVPTPFTQAATASTVVPSHPQPYYPISTPASPPPALGSSFTAEPTTRSITAPILVSGPPALLTPGPEYTSTHSERPQTTERQITERQTREAQAPVLDSIPGGSQPGSLHRNRERDPTRQTTLSIEKIPLDDAETLPGSVHGIGSPRRQGSQAIGVNPLPPLPHEIRIGRPPADRHTSIRARSGLDYIVPVDEKLYREKTAQERLQPTLDRAMAEKLKYATKAKMTGYALNLAIGLQVLLGALTTGLSAVTTGHQTSIMTAILGGLSTVVASYLARARGSNEPELSITRVKDLEQFIRECDAFMMDHGHVVGDKCDQTLDLLRRRFEELLGNSNGERRLSPPV